MHTIKIKVSNKIYEHILFLLKSLEHKDLIVLEVDKKEDNEYKKDIKAKIKQLINNNVKLFENIENPIMWQKKQREEWE